MYFSAIVTVLLLGTLKTATSEINVEKFVEDVRKDEPFKDSKLMPLRDSYVVKLAIFGDVDFGRRFNQSDEQILKYWQAVMYDVHLRFQTLSSVSISFQVTSLTTFKTPDEQLFLENSRDENGTYILEKVRDNVENWTYSKLDPLPVFDIALFQLSFSEENNFSVFNRKSVCRGRQDNSKKWKAISIQSMLNQPAKRLAYNVAKILGFPDDNAPMFRNACEAQEESEWLCCILGSNDPDRSIYGIDLSRSFSHCTNAFAFLWGSTQNISGCLTKAPGRNITVIDTSELFYNPSKVPAWTMEEQCKILMNDTEAYTVFEFCRATFCVSQAGSKFRPDIIEPHEGSRCGYENLGRCVRGDCIQSQLVIVNVATDKCLVPEKSMFAVDDQPVLRNCSEIPMDRLDDMELDDGIIKWLYSTNNGVYMKQLGLDTDFKLKFSIENDNPRSSWIFEMFGDQDGNKEFLLKNSVTGSCIEASDNGFSLRIIPSCSEENKAARWKLVKNYERPTSFLRKIFKRIRLMFKRFSKTFRHWVSN